MELWSYTLNFLNLRLLCGTSNASLRFCKTVRGSALLDSAVFVSEPVDCETGANKQTCLSNGTGSIFRGVFCFHVFLFHIC